VNDQTSDLLARARATLGDVETVLVHASPATRQEITQILADHDDHGGFALLVDSVQLTAYAIDRHLDR